MELEKLNLDIRDQKSREKTEADSRSTALARALQDYNDMKSETGKAVEQAQKILTEAQNRLEEYRENPPPHADLESLQLICEAREKALEEALSRSGCAADDRRSAGAGGTPARLKQRESIRTRLKILSRHAL